MNYTQTKDNYLVTKSNDLIEASYKLTVNEQKLILVVSSLVKVEDEDFKTYRIEVKDLINTLKMDSKNVYRELQKLTKNLMSKVLVMYEPNRKNPNKMDTIQLNWFSSVRYLGGEGAIEARFDPALKPFLLNLKRHFTSYRLKNIIQLKSSYSIRIYEILKQYQQVGERTLHIDKIKEMLGIESKQYARYNNFKQKVLMVAHDEINGKTDINFEFEEIKIGRKIEKIKFIITSKKICSIDVEEEVDVDVLDLETKIKINTLKSIVNSEISDKEYKKVLDVANGDIAKIIEKFYLIKDKKNINNIVGLLIDALRNDYKDIKLENKNKMKTKFHNFKDRFENYSEDDLEKIVIEKQKKKFG